MRSAWEDNGAALHAARVPVRLALGSSMLYHGLSKLRGEGPEQTAQFFEQVGIRPAKGLAVATGIVETLAGAAAVLGLATRPAAVAVLVTQTVAVARVHASKGFDVAKGGYEYNLVLMAIATALLVSGPGRVSAHEALERAVDRRSGWWRRRTRPTIASRAVRLLK